jgi:predicted protein tyrosine phosphatase
MSQWFHRYGFAEILDDLLIGAYPLDHEDVEMLDWMGVERVLNLVQDSEYQPGQREEVEASYAAAGIEEHRLDVVDYGHLPPEAVEATVQAVLAWLREGRRTYLHCRAGWQRSAAIAAGVVALREEMGIDAALDVVQSRKPTADPLPHQRADLQQWWHEREVTA